MAQKAKKKKTSLCEKSMQMVVNLIKLSSFSIASINLGASSALHGKNQALSKSLSQSFDISVSQLSGSRRSQGPENSKKYTYLMEQDGEKSSYKISGNKNDDGNFSDYIKKFHERNGNGSSAAITKDNTAATNGKVSNYIRRFHERNHNVLMSASNLPHLSVLPPPQPKYLDTKLKRM